MRLEIEGRGDWQVNPDDAFYIKAGEKHRAGNIGRDNAVLITVVCPPRY